ncbi:hypothetical protein [Lysinibacillus sp. TE18511]
MTSPVVEVNNFRYNVFRETPQVGLKVTVTSYDNAFVTNITLPEEAHYFLTKNF